MRIKNNRTISRLIIYGVWFGLAAILIATLHAENAQAKDKTNTRTLSELSTGKINPEISESRVSNPRYKIITENLQFRAEQKKSGNPIYRGIVSAYAGMIYTQAGKVDIDATLAQLKDLGVNGYTYLIYQKSEAELEALPEFCRRAGNAGLEVWVYLVPPSEAPGLRKEPINDRKYPPFDMDYLKWAETIATISVTHPNLTLWMLDDFDGNLNYFTLEYTRKMYEISKKINPKLWIGYCVYHDRLKKFVDAGYMPYTDALLFGYQHNFRIFPEAGINAETLPIEINDYYKACKDRDRLIIPCIYFSKHSSWPADRPTKEYLAESMKTSFEQSGVIWVYTTPEVGSWKFELVKNYVRSLHLEQWKQ